MLAANRAAAPVIPNEIVGNGTAFADPMIRCPTGLSHKVETAICLNNISACTVGNSYGLLVDVGLHCKWV